MRIHSKDDLYKCDKLDKDFAQNEVIALHNIMIHFAKKYKQKNASKHVRMHSGDKIYKFDQCSLFWRKVVYKYSI